MRGRLCCFDLRSVQLWVSISPMLCRLLVADQGRTVVAVFRHVREQGMRFVDGDDALVHGQDDADIQFWNPTSRRAREMVQRSLEHLLGTFQVVPQIALGAAPNLLRMVPATMLAVGVRPEVEDRGANDVAEARQ